MRGLHIPSNWLLAGAIRAIVCAMLTPDRRRRDATKPHDQSGSGANNQGGAPTRGRTQNEAEDQTSDSRSKAAKQQA